MGAHEHEVRTKTDRLIAAVEALTAELRLHRGASPFSDLLRQGTVVCKVGEDMKAVADARS